RGRDRAGAGVLAIDVAPETGHRVVAGEVETIADAVRQLCAQTAVSTLQNIRVDDVVQVELSPQAVRDLAGRRVDLIGIEILPVPKRVVGPDGAAAADLPADPGCALIGVRRFERSEILGVPAGDSL